MKYKTAHLPAIYGRTNDLPESAWRQDGGVYVEYAGDRLTGDKVQRVALLRERQALRTFVDDTLNAADSEGRGLRDSERNATNAAESRMTQIANMLDELEATRPEGPAWVRPGADTESGTLARSYAPGPRFAQMFPGQSRADTGGFKSLGDFVSGLQMGVWDQRYQALLSGGSNDDGATGLLIPGQFGAELLDMSLESEVVRPRARPFPMASDTLTISGLAVGGDGAPFGVSGGWTAQGEEIGQVNPQARALMLVARGLKVITQVTNEAISDGRAIQGASLEQQLSEALPKGLGWMLDRSFLRGTGAGQPMGILNAPCTIEVAKESGQEADTILYENLAAMFGRLHPASVPRSVWVANPSTIPQLLQLSVVVGVGGSAIPVLRDDGNGGFTILTRPVVFTEKLPALGDAGDILLADFSQYAVGLRAQMMLEKSAHAGFTRDTTYWRAVIRADGLPMWDEPYTPDSGPTLSPFVKLAARA